MKKSRVFVDGALIGLADDPQALVAQTRAMRRQGSLSTEVNVSYKEFNNDVVIHTDRGRARRPLIVLHNGKPLITPDDIDKLRKNEINFNYFVPPFLHKPALPLPGRIDPFIHHCSVSRDVPCNAHLQPL